MIERKHANRLLASLTCFIMNKLKHVLGEGYLYSEIRVEQVGNCLVGAGSCEGKRGGGPYTVRVGEVGPELGPGGEVPFMASFEISWVMVTWNPPPQQNDRHD